MGGQSRGAGSGMFGGLVFLVGLVLVVLAAIVPVASSGFEERWQWMLMLVVGAALIAGGLAVAALTMLVRSIPDPRDELNKISRKVDRISGHLDEVEAELPGGRQSSVDPSLSRETRRR